MRIVFVILLVANFVVLALFQFSGGRGGGTESAAGHVPYQADKVKVVVGEPLPSPLPAAAEAEKAPVSAVDAAPAASTAEPVKPTPAPAVPPKPVVAGATQCLEWSNIADADLDRARNSLQSLKLAEKAVFRKMEKTTGYWVYVPPRKSFAEAQKKAGELKAIGVADIFILQENTAWRHAISLGVFSTEEAAAKYLSQLRDKGVRSAVAGSRNRAAENNVAALKNLDAGAAQEITRLQKDFEGSDIHTVDCR